MGYRKSLDLARYGTLLPHLEKALLLAEGESLSIKVTGTNLNSIAFVVREFFAINPHIPKRAFAVSAHELVIDGESKSVVKITRRAPKAINLKIEEMENV